MGRKRHTDDGERGINRQTERQKGRETERCAMYVWGSRNVYRK